jgi:hypothetical protein
MNAKEKKEGIPTNRGSIGLGRIICKIERS